jgi:hypothetical protein
MSSGNGSALLDPAHARKALAHARGQDKLDLLLSAPDPVEMVQSIPEEELYLAILDIGRDDAAEIVALASPEQFRCFIDLACWPRRDEGVQPKDVMHWLRLAREGGGRSEAAEKRYLEKLAGLDLELLSLILHRQLRVHDLEEGDDPQLASEDAGIYRTPEGRYMVEILEGFAGYPAIKTLLDDLYAQDVLATTRLLESLRWDMPTELEEVARRWRDGRLRDLGFPDFEEAISFYARPARREPSKAVPVPPPGTALVAPAVGLLDRALAQLSDEAFDRAEQGILYAANASLVANRVALDDPTEVREQLQQARATLSLGLELLSGGEVEHAALVLAETPVRTIFQEAMREVYRLSARARGIAQSARLPSAQSATLLDSPLAEMVDALARQRPVFLEPGRKRARALGSRADLARAEELLDEAAAMVAILEALGLSPAVLGPLAETAGLGAAALRASDAVRMLAESQLHGRPLSLSAVAAGGDRPKSAALDQKIDELLRSATAAVNSPAAESAAGRLRTILAR